jgi:hypothetical protein
MLNTSSLLVVVAVEERMVPLPMAQVGEVQGRIAHPQRTHYWLLAIME